MFKKIVFALSMLLLPLSLFADASQGEALEKQMWQNIKDHKWKDLDNMIAPYFQVAFFDGVLNKQQYLIHAKALSIHEYTLSDFKVTEGPDLFVVTYTVETSETIEGKRLLSNAFRLSVWQKNKNEWLMAAHAILIPVTQANNK